MRTLLRERVIAAGAGNCAGAAEPLADAIERFCDVLDPPSRRDLEVVAGLWVEIIQAAAHLSERKP